MPDLITLAVFTSAAGASLLMAWTIGAGSAGSTPFAPAVGAQAVSILRAAFIVGICIFAGALTQGANVSEAVGRELIVGVSLSPSGAALALVVAATLVTIGIFSGYPIATAFTVTGAVIGVGLAMGGDPNWPKYVEIFGMWLLIPVVGGVIAFAIVRILLNERLDERFTIVVLAAIVGAILAHIELTILDRSGDGASLATVISDGFAGGSSYGVVLVTIGSALLAGLLVYTQLRADRVRGQQRFIMAMGLIVAFSAGGSQVGLAVGPLLPIFDDVLPVIAVLFGGGIGLLIGAWTGAPRMIKAIAQDFASLGPRRALAALVPSFVIAQVAILVGVPVSFNQIIVSGVVGSGAAVSEGGVSRGKLSYTVLGWTASFIGSVGLCYLGYVVIDALV